MNLSAGHEFGKTISSPGWYAAMNEMILLRRFVDSEGLAEDYESFKQEHWPKLREQILDFYSKDGLK